MSAVPVYVLGRWAIVTVDERAVQCTVSDTEGGCYFVRGYGDASIAQAAEYARQYGTTYATRSEAMAVIEGEDDR